jgi:hypothetical protein
MTKFAKLGDVESTLPTFIARVAIVLIYLENDKRNGNDLSIADPYQLGGSPW